MTHSLSCFDGPTFTSRYILTCLCPDHPCASVERQIWWSAASWDENVNVPVCGPLVLTTTWADDRSSTLTRTSSPGSASHEPRPSSQTRAPYFPACQLRHAHKKLRAVDSTARSTVDSTSRAVPPREPREPRLPQCTQRARDMAPGLRPSSCTTHPRRPCRSAAPQRSTASRSSQSRSGGPGVSFMLAVAQPLRAASTHLRQAEHLRGEQECRELHRRGRELVRVAISWSSMVVCFATRRSRRVRRRSWDTWRSAILLPPSYRGSSTLARRQSCTLPGPNRDYPADSNPLSNCSKLAEQRQRLAMATARRHSACACAGHIRLPRSPTHCATSQLLWRECA